MRPEPRPLRGHAWGVGLGTAVVVLLTFPRASCDSCEATLGSPGPGGRGRRLSRAWESCRWVWPEAGVGGGSGRRPVGGWPPSSTRSPGLCQRGNQECPHFTDAITKAAGRAAFVFMFYFVFSGRECHAFLRPWVSHPPMARGAVSHADPHSPVCSQCQERCPPAHLAVRPPRNPRRGGGQSEEVGERGPRLSRFPAIWLPDPNAASDPAARDAVTGLWHVPAHSGPEAPVTHSAPHGATRPRVPLSMQQATSDCGGSSGRWPQCAGD